MENNKYDPNTDTERFVPTFDEAGETRVELATPRSAEVLRQLGDAVLTRIEAGELQAAVDAHIAETGQSHTNEHGAGFFIGNPPNGLPMNEGHSYRSVDQRAINDLAETGVVRGAHTATEGARKNTTSHATFWSDGKAGINHPFATPGHFIIEAPTEHLDAPVTADKLTGVYARDESGELTNILDQSSNRP